MSTKLHIYIIKMVQFIENSSLKSEWIETWIFFFVNYWQLGRTKQKCLSQISLAIRLHSEQFYSRDHNINYAG